MFLGFIQDTKITILITRKTKNKMNNEYYSCTKCGHNIPEYGQFTECNEEFGGCGKWYCSDECAQVQKCEYDVEGDY